MNDSISIFRFMYKYIPVKFSSFKETTGKESVLISLYINGRINVYMGLWTCPDRYPQTSTFMSTYAQIYTKVYAHFNVVY